MTLGSTSPNSKQVFLTLIMLIAMSECTTQSAGQCFKNKLVCNSRSLDVTFEENYNLTSDGKILVKGCSKGYSDVGYKTISSFKASSSYGITLQVKGQVDLDSLNFTQNTQTVLDENEFGMLPFVWCSFKTFDTENLTLTVNKNSLSVSPTNFSSESCMYWKSSLTEDHTFKLGKYVYFTESSDLCGYFTTTKQFFEGNFLTFTGDCKTGIPNFVTQENVQPQFDNFLRKGGTKDLLPTCFNEDFFYCKPPEPVTEKVCKEQGVTEVPSETEVNEKCPACEVCETFGTRAEIKTTLAYKVGTTVKKDYPILDQITTKKAIDSYTTQKSGTYKISADFLTLLELFVLFQFLKLLIYN